MPLTREKRILPTIISSPITPAVLLIAAILLMFSVYERYTVEREMAARRAAAESELEAAHVRAALLEEKVEYLRADHGVEAEIRKHFDVARDGEQVVVLVGEPSVADVAASDTPAHAETETRGGFWSWLFP